MMGLIAKGWSNKEIANHFGVTEGVVKNYVERAADSLGIPAGPNRRVMLAVHYIRNYETNKKNV